MGRWTPLVLMAGGLAILMGTLLGINFPMSEGQRVSKNTQGDKASKVLPANINVNSSAPSKGRNNSNTPENRNNVAQEEFNTNDNANAGDTAEERGNLSQEDRRTTNRTSVAQNNSTTESTPSSENNNTTETNSDTATEVQSTTTSGDSNDQTKEPIRALW